MAGDTVGMQADSFCCRINVMTACAVGVAVEHIVQGGWITMVGEEGAVAGGTISAAGRHGYDVTICRGYGYQSNDISSGIDYMTGRTGVMYFGVGRTYRYIIDPTGSSGMTGDAEGGSRYQSCVVPGMTSSGVVAGCAGTIYCRRSIVVNPGLWVCRTRMAGKAGRGFEVGQGRT
jgi:hypothetical protein